MKKKVKSKPGVPSHNRQGQKANQGRGGCKPADQRGGRGRSKK